MPGPMRTNASNFFPTSLALSLWLGLAGLMLWGWLGGSSSSGSQLLLGLLTLFVSAIVASFSLRYMRGNPRRNGYFAGLGTLAAAVLVFVLTDSVLIFALGWLASGIMLARLIGHADGWDEAAAAARRARRAFLFGDTAVVLALTLLAWHAGSLALTPILAETAAMPAWLQTSAALLLLVGAAARCALPPFSGWLLTSMTAPTPVSALMHAGLVNAGGFLLLRFVPLFEAAPLARLIAVAVGLMAALWGLGIMVVRSDVKRSLAGSTVSQMGFMIMSCGLGAYAAALWHIVAHGLFKAWLFLGANSAIGMRSAAPRAAPGPRVVVVVGALALMVGGVMILLGRTDGELVPLVLAGATAALTLAWVPAARVSLRGKLTIVAAIAALAGVHLLGFGLTRVLVGADGPALLPPLATLALVVPFFAFWLWQAGLGDRRWPVAGALYVRLLNAGTPIPARQGAAQ